jgi:hypothetical protein
MSNSVVAVARRFVVALCLLVVVKPATGADGVTATQSADYKALAKLIFNPDVTGVTINDATTFTGDAQQIGTYDATGTFFDSLPRSGVVMSSGKVVEVKERGNPSTNLTGSGGDGGLTNELKRIGLTGNEADTKDAAVLVVDVTVSKAVNIDIAYVFGSDEYRFPPSVQYADVFGLFHGGANIALIGNDPVSVKTVNCGSTPPRNCGEFIGNISPRIGTSLSGFTKTQVVTLKLPVGTNQKVKIVIADAREYDDDAVVFLGFLRFQLAPTQSPTSKPTQSPTMKPTRTPTHSPTSQPTKNPTGKPTQKPVMKMTQNPVLPPMPLVAPSPPPAKGKMKMMGMMGEMM